MSRQTKEKGKLSRGWDSNWQTVEETHVSRAGWVGGDIVMTRANAKAEVTTYVTVLITVKLTIPSISSAVGPTSCLI